MTRLFTAAAFLMALGFIVTAKASAAPAPPATKTVETWEYCEVTSASRAALVRPIGGGGGAVQPAQPAQMATPIRFTSGSEDVEATSWEDLATKLKIPEGKKDASVNAHKMRVLNWLGEQGWEMVIGTQAPTTGMGSWTFKRKVIKEVKETKESKESKEK